MRRVIDVNHNPWSIHFKTKNDRPIEIVRMDENGFFFAWPYLKRNVLNLDAFRYPLNVPGFFDLFFSIDRCLRTG